MEVSPHFKATIKEYLDKRANEDPLFARSYQKEHKSLDDCCKYVLAQVYKSGCNGFEDMEIYGMCADYYDEDTIIIENVENMRVAVNHHVELTKEELEQARLDAIKQAQLEAYRNMTKPKSKPSAAKKEENTMLSLFD